MSAYLLGVAWAMGPLDEEGHKRQFPRVCPWVEWGAVLVKFLSPLSALAQARPKWERAREKPDSSRRREQGLQRVGRQNYSPHTKVVLSQYFRSFPKATTKQELGAVSFVPKFQH